MPVSLSILHRSTSSRARRSRVSTPHGSFDTPAFMPVGTRGTVKGILPGLVAAGGAQIAGRLEQWHDPQRPRDAGFTLQQLHRQHVGRRVQ